MKTSDVVRNFENGSLYTILNKKELTNGEWNPHKKFAGVSLKNLAVSSDSGGRVSCHLVRVEPGCELSLHSHENNLEIHEVISGSGTLKLGGNNYEYRSGSLSVIPDGAEHEVIAGPEGLYILAKFIPALI